MNTSPLVLTCLVCDTERQAPDNEITTGIELRTNCFCLKCREITQHEIKVPTVEREAAA